MPETQKDRSAHGTPVVTLGFTRTELDHMEEVAYPGSIEQWLHGLVDAALGLRMLPDASDADVQLAGPGAPDG